MSYCRFHSEAMYEKYWGPGGSFRLVAESLGQEIPTMDQAVSNVYIYGCNDGLQCCGCSLNPHGHWAANAQDMIGHLHLHRAAGDAVPDHVFEALDAEIKELEESDANSPA